MSTDNTNPTTAVFSDSPMSSQAESPVVSQVQASPIISRSADTTGPSPMNLDEPQEAPTTHTIEFLKDEIQININTSSEELIAKAHKNIEIMTKKATILFGNYLALSHNDAESTATADALACYNDYDKKLKALKSTVESFALSTGVIKMQDPVSSAGSSAAANALVPKLPALQLTTDHSHWSKGEPFESVMDFCTSFEKILRAHSLVFDKHWERLLPLCLSNAHNSWCTEKLLSKDLTWEQAKSKLLDFFDTPYRKFLLMAEVGSLRQGDSESTRVYAENFQKLRREAGYEDGTQLVVNFWVSLRESVRRASLSAIASRFGTKLPTSIDEMVELVCAVGEDSSLLSTIATSGGAAIQNSYASGSASNKRQRTGDNKNKGVSKSPFKKNLPSNNESTTLVAPRKPCSFCGNPWVSGHRCQEFYLHKKEMIKENKRIMNNPTERVSRMAHRSIHAPTMEELEQEEQEVNDQIDRMATDCKVSHKHSETERGTNIIFPIIINNRRAISLLDCGADFSSIDLNYCRKHNIHINYFNKEFVKQHTIRLADKDISIKRIGSCITTIKCNNKTLIKKFEVMNLTNATDEFVMSIGTDYMKQLGIGIIGLPLTYDDYQSSTSLIEASRRFNEASELLEELEQENKKNEDSPAGNKYEMKEALEFIQPFIDTNLAIPKGSFCTIPESVVHLNTPENATGFRKPYPIPLVYHKIVDDQIQEWLDNGFIKRTTGNVDWNSPLTVVKKTNAKGEITGYRVCHDPRHINILLQKTDRMPLPIIQELFEELKDGCVYSTLDLKSAFNSLRLNPADAHKLSFMWRNVQYTPIATMFGIKHVSSQFQRTMSIALEGLTQCRFFVDDLVVVSKSMNEHKMHLKQVIERLTKVNLRLNPDKCKFFQSKIFLLGFHISPKGISMDRRKLVNVLESLNPEQAKMFKDTAD